MSFYKAFVCIRSYKLTPGSLYDWSNYWAKGIKHRTAVRYYNKTYFPGREEHWAVKSQIHISFSLAQQFWGFLLNFDGLFFVSTFQPLIVI